MNRLYRTEVMRRVFPNLEHLNGVRMTVENAQIDNWMQEKLRGAELFIDTDDITLAEKFKDLHLEELKIELNAMSGLNVTNEIIKNHPNADISLSLTNSHSIPQIDCIKDLKLNIDTEIGLATDYLVKNTGILRSLKILAVQGDQNCFFGHTTLDLPHLEELQVYVGSSLCDPCWAACFQSCRAVNRLSYVNNKVALKHLAKLANLKHISFEIDSIHVNPLSYEINVKRVMNVKSINFTAVEKQSIKKMYSLLKLFPTVEVMTIYTNFPHSYSAKRFNQIDFGTMMMNLEKLVPNIRVIRLNSAGTSSDSCLAIEIPFERVPLLVKAYIDCQVFTRNFDNESKGRLC